jgi:hypothetical protein
LADACRESLDPYIVNSIGNCHGSLGEWADARAQYLLAARTFQAASGFRDARTGGTTSRVDGAIFAATNAALAAAQLGDLAAAQRELEAVARRGPGSVDARAALAAVYYDAGRVEDAEAAWEYACSRITAGCSKYRDAEWLTKVRRWPPVLVAMLGRFLTLTRGGGGGGRGEAGSAGRSGEAAAPLGEAPAKDGAEAAVPGTAGEVVSAPALAVERGALAAETGGVDPGSGDAT